MEYKVAYGAVNTTKIMSSSEIDKLVADKVRNKPIKVATTPPKPQHIKPISKPESKPIKKLTDAFNHLKKPTTNTITKDTSEAYAHLKPKASKPVVYVSDPFAHIKGRK